MKTGIERECKSLLVICCEGNSSYLTEEKYCKELSVYLKEYNPKYALFNEIQVIKIKVNEIFDVKRLINKLVARGIKAKYSYVAIWKDNDQQENIQKENGRLLAMENNLWKSLKKYLMKNKQVKENFNIWLLPKGWNFETYYRMHFSNSLKISDKKLKEKFKEPNHFRNTIFTEKHFRTIDLNLKKQESNIIFFDFKED